MPLILALIAGALAWAVLQATWWFWLALILIWITYTIHDGGQDVRDRLAEAKRKRDEQLIADADAQHQALWKGDETLGIHGNYPPVAL